MKYVHCTAKVTLTSGIGTNSSDVSTSSLRFSKLNPYPALAHGGTCPFITGDLPMYLRVS